MDLGEKINYFITDRCNLNCDYCLADHSGKGKRYESNVPLITNKILNSGVKKVTISGGEPMLVSSLPNSLKTFSDAGIYASLHTNGYFINEESIRSIDGVVNEVYLPLDSSDKSVNDSLRGVGSFNNFEKAFNLLRNKNIPVGIHTVLTRKNVRGLENLKKYLDNKDFFSWKIYEKNNLASNGEQTHDLLEDFLLSEDSFGFKDTRTKFIANVDKNPYLFLNNKGEISYSPWFFGEGKKFGNLFNENYKVVLDKVKNYVGEDAPDFFEGLWNLPLFARYVEGAYDSEEIDELSVNEFDKMIMLSELYSRHIS